MRYWKEETLCRFLIIPDALGPGPVVYQMASYLGAFPFPSLAPSILTLEAMVKVVVVMTERYGKVLKKGKADRNKLLFRSLAVFDRRMSIVEQEKPAVKDSPVSEETPGSPTSQRVTSVEEKRTHVAGFAVDAPGEDLGDEEDEDDDELALAALDALDAIEVFREDQTTDRKIHHAQIPSDNFRRLLTLLIIVAPLGSQEPLSVYAEGLTQSRLDEIRQTADCVLRSFINVEESPGINYHTFTHTVSSSLPYLFDGLNPLFEHFLFSKNIDLSRKRNSSSASASKAEPATPSQSITSAPLLKDTADILNASLLSQLSFFIPGNTIIRRLQLLYSGSSAGFSLGSFTTKVLNWNAPSILLVTGTRIASSISHQSVSARSFTESLGTSRLHSATSSPKKEDEKLTFGAYLSVPWKQTPKSPIGDASTLLFQLSPTHSVFRPSAYNTSYATFTKDGIAFGCPLPPSTAATTTSRTQATTPHSPLGPVSVFLNSSLEYGVFTHETAGGGSFYPNQTLGDFQERFEVEAVEVWGCGGDEEAERQREAWAWEEREAARRRQLNVGKGDVEADRELLKMAGIISGDRSGGSMA